MTRHHHHLEGRTSARLEDASAVHDLPGIGLRDSGIESQRPSTAQDRWESDGGSARRPVLTGRRVQS